MASTKGCCSIYFFFFLVERIFHKKFQHQLVDTRTEEAETVVNNQGEAKMKMQDVEQALKELMLPARRGEIGVMRVNKEV